MKGILVKFRYNELVYNLLPNCCLAVNIATMYDGGRKYFGWIAMFESAKNVLFRFVHKMVGAPRCTHPPEKIGLRQLCKMFFLSTKFYYLR